MDDRYPALAARLRVPLAFGFSAAYLVLAQPTQALLLAGGGMALAGLCLRAWAAGHIEKNVRLTTGGPYRYTRNPLYLGSALIGLGFAVAGKTWILGVVFAILFILLYWPLIRREERMLFEIHGRRFLAYAEAVSSLLPTRRGPAIETERFLWRRYRENREYQAAIGFLVALGLLLAKMAL